MSSWIPVPRYIGTDATRKSRTTFSQILTDLATAMQQTETISYDRILTAIIV